MKNALSFDVEDYFQVTALQSAVDRRTWDLQASRVERNTAVILDVLARRGVMATFFVLGWIAERHPNVVRRISECGHEIACHGYSHELIYRQTPETFREETVRARSVLEDQVQQRIRGYRAATWSITSRSLWALDIISEQGFDYDSSVFPTHHDLYGVPGAERGPHRIPLPEGGSILEFPPSTVRLAGINWPVAGGGYFRMLPLAVTKWAIQRVNAEGMPFLFYLHPWEVDVDQPRMNVGLKSRFRHYTNLEGCQRKLERLLDSVQMGRVCDVLDTPEHDTSRIAEHGKVAAPHGAVSPS